jgi:hypothetical protein
MIKLKTILETITEKMELIDYSEYSKLVAKAYDDAPDYDPSAVKHWNALRDSNYTLFNRLLSRTTIIFVSEEAGNDGKKISINGKDYIVKKVDGEPYDSQPEMRTAWQKTGKLMISIDHSEHPIFSVEDNIVFRSVHDFIVHIQGNHPFGLKGEIASYNTHAKLVNKEVLPALFTEVVGQASYAVVHGSFPKQKIAILHGFDYTHLGKVSGYHIDKKQLKKDNQR